tara:strand:+ start:152 stop:781 length:630 start_codon:yes stop_codon:yes gene_type:complete
MALLTGGILFVDSYSTPTLKNKEKYFGRSYAVLESKKEYLGSGYLSEYQMQDFAIVSGKIMPYEEWLEKKKNGGKDGGYKGYTNWFFTVATAEDIEKPVDVLLDMHKKYTLEKYKEYSIKNYPEELIDKRNSQNSAYEEYRIPMLKLIKDQENTYKIYKGKVTQKNLTKIVRRGTSILVTAWGFSVLSVSSVISSVFSIERNTRKIDPN